MIAHLPYTIVPRVAADALTIAVQFDRDATGVEVRSRVYPTGDPVPAYQVKYLPGVLRGQIVQATFEGLVEGTTYVIDTQALDVTGATETVTASLAWSPEDVLFPTLSGFQFEDFRAGWLAMMPWYYQDEPLTNFIMRRVGQEFQRLQAAVEEVIRFILPSLSYAEGLARWEQVLGIHADPEQAPEDERRQAVISQLLTRTDHSAKRFIEIMSAVQGSPLDVYENFANYSIAFALGASSADFEFVLREVAARIKPAHLNISFLGAFLADISLAGDSI